ncbi:MAG: tetratricopeptide repeat protein [Spirochaetota bacterium]
MSILKIKVSLFIIIILIFILILSCSSTNPNQNNNKLNNIDELISESNTIPEDITNSCKIFETKLELGDYFNIGLRSELRGEYKSALKYYELSYEYGRLWDDYFIQIYSIAGISRIQIYLEQYGKALSSIKSTEDLNNKRQKILEIESLCYENRALLYYYTDDYEKAEIYYLKALKIYKNCGVASSIAELYNNLGLVYIKTENYEKAEELFLKALKLNVQLDNHTSQSINLTNLGILYKTIDRFEKAEKMYYLALEIDKREKKFEFIGKDLFNLAELYYDYDKTQLAIDFYDRTINYVESLESPTIDYLNIAIKSCDKMILIAQNSNDKQMEEEYTEKKEWFIKKLKKYS